MTEQTAAEQRTEDRPCLLKMTGISKAFGRVQALRRGEIELRSGEVHALMGENGAGKSTLMKILTGIYSKDEGQILYDGKEIAFVNPREAQEAGVVIVHQELNMMNDLSVSENIWIGRESMEGLLINDRDMERKSQALFERLGVKIDPKAKTGDLTVGKQQMVEIAKAISMNARIVVFDEPTAALTDVEIDELFKIIRDLRAQGMGIIYISHRMDEIGVITDRVTVMRDGEYVGTLLTPQMSKEQLVKMMVGRAIFEEPKTHSAVAPDAPVVLEVKNLCAGRMVKDVSFQLRRGEILGFSGLMGAGRTETCRAIYGADTKDSGEILVRGEAVSIKKTHDAVSLGIAYLSEDRRRYGLVTDFDLSNNTVMACLENYLRGFLIDDKKIDREAEKYVESLKIKCGSIKQAVRTLSGGNQQKVVIAKWLSREADILIFDEPTRGIDVGAKSEIYKLMNELAAQGKSIIMVSSELPEILRMSDRIVVMCEGKKTGELSIEEASQEKIIQLATRDMGM